MEETTTLTVREMYDIWRNLSDTQLTLFVIPTIDRYIARAKEEHQFYAWEFFRHWRKMVTEKVTA